MAESAYQESNHRAGAWLAYLSVAIAAQLAAVALIQHYNWGEQLGAWRYLATAFPFFAVLAVGFGTISQRDRDRFPSLQATLSDLGFILRANPDAAARQLFAVPVDMLRLRTGVKGLQWGAAQTTGLTRALMFEHAFISGRGDDAETHRHTVFVWPGDHADIANPDLPSLGWFSLGRFPAEERRTFQDLEVTDTAFSDLASHWSAVGDVETGRRFLTPGVRRELCRAPLGEVWYVGAGWIICAFRGKLDAKNMRRFAEHARATLAHTAAPAAVRHRAVAAERTSLGVA